LQHAPDRKASRCAPPPHPFPRQAVLAIHTRRTTCTPRCTRRAQEIVRGIPQEISVSGENEWRRVKLWYIRLPRILGGALQVLEQSGENDLQGGNRRGPERRRDTVLDYIFGLRRQRDTNFFSPFPRRRGDASPPPFHPSLATAPSARLSHPHCPKQFQSQLLPA